MKIHLAFFCLSLLFASVSCDLQSEWAEFKIKFKKTFAPEEDSKRMEVFQANKKSIEDHNKLFEKGLVSFKRAINQFADFTATEVRSRFTGYQKTRPDGAFEKRTTIKTFGPVPDQIDWRKAGAVTEVRRQGDCGSCYAFSAIGAIEGQYFRETGSLQKFSEQQIVDCYKTGYNRNGCRGGEPANVFEYISTVGGLDTEESYSYRERFNLCHYQESSAIASIEGFEKLEVSEEALKNAVAHIGPISVAIHTTSSMSNSYDSGIFDDPDCHGWLDHAVLVVGYGSENGSDYWIVKNSWGEDWGEDGYIRMARNKNNLCGIASEAMYPVGVKRRNVSNTIISKPETESPKDVSAKVDSSNVESPKAENPKEKLPIHIYIFSHFKCRFFFSC
jgi:cathepsin L